MSAGMDLLKEWMSQRTASFGEEAKKYGLPEPKGNSAFGCAGLWEVVNGQSHCESVETATSAPRCRQNLRGDRRFQRGEHAKGHLNGGVGRALYFVD